MPPSKLDGKSQLPLSESNPGVVLGGWPLTGREDVVPDLVALGPARPGQAGVVYLLEGHALAPGEGDAEPQGDVDGDDDEPHEPLGPPVGDAEHRDGEGRLAPQGGEDGEGARHVAVQQEGHEQVEVEVVQRPAEAQGYCVGDESACCGQG